jgi:hypothetical protein
MKSEASNSLKNIVDSTLVPHSAFQEAATRIEQCFNNADGASEPICIAVVGESRTGKSRVLEEFDAKHPRARDSDGLNVPILRVKTPAKPTVKGLAEIMLRGMGDPRFEAGTEIGKTIRLRTLIQAAGTLMVMIDEFQHFYDKTSHKVMHHVADWLKILVEDCKVALVVAGLPSCRAVLDQNEQLLGRFLEPILMPRFDWKIGDEREEFIGILSAFHESISEHFDLPSLSSAEMAFRCYCGTGGLIGYLTKFLRQAVWNAIDHKRKTISFEDLARAHKQSIWAKAGPPEIASPFTRAFVQMPSEDLLEKIRRIGTPAEETPIERLCPVRRPRSPTVREVLATR